MWQREQWGRCPGCGQPRDEAWVFAPEQELDYRARYEAETRLCVPCDTLAREQKRFQNGKSAYAGGVFTVLKPPSR